MAPRAVSRRVKSTQRRMTRYKRNVGYSALYKGIQNKAMPFVRTGYFPAALTSLTGINYVALGDSSYLGQLPNVGEFGALFDQYRIDKVEVSFIPRFDTVDANNANLLPRIFSVVDHDDASTPTNLDTMLQYANVRSAPFNKPHKITYVPTCTNQVYGSAVSTGYAPKAHQWLDIGNTGVLHYGHKVWIDLHGSQWANTFKVDIMLKMYFSCKNVR